MADWCSASFAAEKKTVKIPKMEESEFWLTNGNKDKTEQMIKMSGNDDCK